VYFNVNFNVFFKIIKVHLLVNELYMFPVLITAYLPPREAHQVKYLWQME